jgi:hypothetical protein
MRTLFMSVLAAASITASVGYAEEGSHSTRGSNPNAGGGISVSVDNTPERPEPSSRLARPTNTIPVPAGRIMSNKELRRAGLKPDDVVMHVSVF